MGGVAAQESAGFAQVFRCPCRFRSQFMDIFACGCKLRPALRTIIPSTIPSDHVTIIVHNSQSVGAIIRNGRPASL